MKISMWLYALLLVAGLAPAMASAREGDQRNDIYSDPVIGPYTFGPARYNTTLYDQRYGRWPGAPRQAAPEDHFNQKSDVSEKTRRPLSYGYDYPVHGGGCVLTVEEQFNQRSNPQLSCGSGRRSAGPPPLLKSQDTSPSCSSTGLCFRP